MTLVLTFTRDMKFYLQDIMIEDCSKYGVRTGKQGKRFDRAFNKCLKALAEKLVSNEKLKQDGKLYLMADRGLPYGLVLRVMGKVRQGGITKFGLIAEPSGEGKAKR